MNKKTFISRISDSFCNGEVSLFLGAGTSIDANFPKWSDLLEPCAEELGLDINNVSDYFQLAQYYINEYGESELYSLINERINKFDYNSKALDIIVKMGFKSVWTTNFDKVIEIGNKYFSKKRNNNKVNVEKAIYTPNYFFKQKELEQMQCIIGFEGLSYNDENKYKLSVMNHIFGSGMSSRLFQEVREKNGLCYTIYSYNDFTFDTGSFQIYTGVEPKNINKAIDNIVLVIKEMLEDVKEEELNRAKVKLKSSLLMSLENTNSRASSNGLDLIKYNRIIDEKEIIENIDKTTIEDVKNILKNIVSTQPSIALYGDCKNVYSYNEIKNKFSYV